jgi:hypothetical protein
LTPNPIRKVLSTFQSYEVRALLMGGQACVLYGAAEFSRDTDFAILADGGNLERLQRAMSHLQAEVIAVPPLDPSYLARGHAVHFRCHHPDASGMRVDIMAKMRGVAPFEDLWARRASIMDEEGTSFDLLALPDLVAAKKTQRDKDWPMIRRLIEADYASGAAAPNLEQVRFWMKEARTPELLKALVSRFPAEADSIAANRPLLRAAKDADDPAIERALLEEEQTERAADRAYWAPLRRELEELRRARLKAR